MYPSTLVPTCTPLIQLDLLASLVDSVVWSFGFPVVPYARILARAVVTLKLLVPVALVR